MTVNSGRRQNLSSSCLIKSDMPAPSVCLFNPRRASSPNVQYGVAAPRSPCLRHFFGLPGAYAAEIVANGNVFLRKCIRPAQRAHRDVMGSPLTNARQVCQPFDRFIGIMISAVV